MSLDTPIENPAQTPSEPPQLLTEPSYRWMAWLTLSLVLAVVVGFFIWVGVAGASAPGGCGGG